MLGPLLQQKVCVHFVVEVGHVLKVGGLYAVYLFTHAQHTSFLLVAHDHIDTEVEKLAVEQEP